MNTFGGIAPATHEERATAGDPVRWWHTVFGEEEIAAMGDAVRHEHVSQGPVVREFESRLEERLGVSHVVATTSGSTALLMSMLAVGVGPGDEVIVPNRTWIATAHAAALLGARVRFADVEARRPIIDVDSIRKIISKRTKLIVPVHLNGRSADMRAIRSLADEHGIAVVEDAAQAIGSRNRDGYLGTQAEMGCFSLSVAKIIATGQGGFITTNSAERYEQLVAIRTHGVGSVIDAEWTQLGFNFRFTDILASIGIVQLGRLDARIAAVTRLYERYVEGLRDLPFLELIPVDVVAGEIPIYVEVLAPERERLIAYLADERIQTRPFYPDLDTASYFGAAGDFPNSRRFAAEGIFLPCGPNQPLENVDRVIAALRRFR